MSDAREQGRGATAPLPVTAQPGTAGPRAQTQVSAASAVPSTLDSPQERAQPGAIVDTSDGGPTEHAAPRSFAEIDGAALRDAGSPPSAPGLPVPDAGRRVGPATLMSPAVLASDRPPSPPLAPENAVIDVGAPAHAFLPKGAAPPHGAPGAMMHHGAFPHGGAAPGRRPPSTTFLVVVGVAVVAGLVLVAGIVVGLFFFSQRRAAEAAEGSRRASSVPAAPLPTVEAARGPARFGGARARLAVTSSGALEGEAVRVALATAIPRIDGCFAATELEPPNHESAAYDLEVLASGEVKRAEPATTTNRTVRLDACVVQSLRGVRMPRAARASTVKLVFSAPVELR